MVALLSPTSLALQEISFTSRRMSPLLQISSLTLENIDSFLSSGCRRLSLETGTFPSRRASSAGDGCPTIHQIISITLATHLQFQHMPATCTSRPIPSVRPRCKCPAQRPVTLTLGGVEGTWVVCFRELFVVIAVPTCVRLCQQSTGSESGVPACREQSFETPQLCLCIALVLRLSQACRRWRRRDSAGAGVRDLIISISSNSVFSVSGRRAAERSCHREGRSSLEHCLPMCCSLAASSLVGHAADPRTRSIQCA